MLKRPETTRPRFVPIEITRPCICCGGDTATTVAIAQQGPTICAPCDGSWARRRSRIRTSESHLIESGATSPTDCAGCGYERPHVYEREAR